MVSAVGHSRLSWGSILTVKIFFFGKRNLPCSAFSHNEISFFSLSFQASLSSWCLLFWPLRPTWLCSFIKLPEHVWKEINEYSHNTISVLQHEWDQYSLYMKLEHRPTYCWHISHRKEGHCGDAQLTTTICRAAFAP